MIFIKHQNNMKYLIISFLLTGFLISCGIQGKKIKPAELQEVSAYNYNSGALPDTLTVMTYNVKYGGARFDFLEDCHGEKVLMTKEEVQANLSSLVRLIRAVSPDILFLQEVDFNAKRSAYVNQLNYILDSTNLNGGIYMPEWRADYVLNSGVGYINSGNAILTKWSVFNSTYIELPEAGTGSSNDNRFPKHQNLLATSIMLPSDEKLHLLCTRISPYSQNGKKAQLEVVAQELAAYQSEGKRFILGGDFSTLPPGSAKVSDFDDMVCNDIPSDFSQETDWMSEFYIYNPAIALSDYQTNNTPYLTETKRSPENGGFWQRKTDYIFTNLSVVSQSGTTLQSTVGEVNAEMLSDHAAVVVRIPINE